MTAQHVIVHGRVQGVFFRDYTRKMALRYSLTGWVRNLPDGSVETVFCGEKEMETKMLSWLRTGSPLSSVTSIEVNNIVVKEKFPSFEIRY